MRIAFFGSSLVSAYWNGAATYYRGLLRAMHDRGHQITFYEPDAWDRQAHRDMPDPDWARVEVWKGEAGLRRSLDCARQADLVVKASGVGAYDDDLEAGVVSLRAPNRSVAFWDVDAPATLARMFALPDDAARARVPEWDVVFTYGGGPPVVDAYGALGARTCVPIYNAHDPTTHHPVAPDARYAATLAFLGNRLPDREERVERFFFAVADALPQERFLLGGSGWADKARPNNVAYVGHVYTSEHNAFNVTPRAVLNICRESMAQVGWSPATRVFEAAAAGACLITDGFEGLEEFLEPGREVLVAKTPEDVLRHLVSLTPERRDRLGRAARERVLAEHTYSVRASRVEEVLVQVAPGGQRA